MAEPTRRASFWDAFRSPRLALMLGLGFASGLPNPVTGSTLTAWLASVHVDVATVGLFGLVHVPYNLKFLWAPVLDRYALPFLSPRRGWMVLTQLLCLVGIGALAFSDPVNAPWYVAGLAFVVSVFSATQDIAVDAYRTELLPPEQRASGAAIFVAAYRGALIAAGAGALVLSELVSWRWVYLGLAALMVVGLGTTLIAPPPDAKPRPPARFREAVVEPLREFLGRGEERALHVGRWAIRATPVVFLLVVMGYKLGDVVGGGVRMSLLIDDLGFSRGVVGGVLKGLGLAASIGGALLGGGAVAKLGLRRALILFGVGQALPNALYGWLAIAGRDHTLMVMSITIDELMNGMGTAAFIALLMALCNQRFTAFQYALFSALMTVPGRLIGGGAGFLVEAVGWPTFYWITVALGLPAVILVALFEIPEPAPEEAPA